MIQWSFLQTNLKTIKKIIKLIQILSPLQLLVRSQLVSLLETPFLYRYQKIIKIACPF